MSPASRNCVRGQSFVMRCGEIIRRPSRQAFNPTPGMLGSANSPCFPATGAAVGFATGGGW